MKKYYVYILSCSNDNFYTGITNNLRRRINQHNGIGWGFGSRYTAKHRPVFLRHVEGYENRKEAYKREREIKTFSHAQKLELIKNTTKEQIVTAI